MSGLSFAVKPADSSSGMQNLNLNNIPGVMAWIKESVEPAVEEMFIEPNYLSVDLPQ
jgi:Ca2+-dependent lipid-binding protein